VEGVATEVSPISGNRIVCYCEDCQAFSHFLERPDVLDTAGGTDIFQMAPSRLRITEGVAALRCMRLSDKGMYRWYAECCRTPIGNTLGAWIPFVGLIHSFMGNDKSGRALDALLGPPVGYINGGSALGGLPPHARPATALRATARSARLVAEWWVTGKGSPSVFFDPRTKAPRIEPRVLGTAEREALRERTLRASVESSFASRW
jgi:hypothetical protein